MSDWNPSLYLHFAAERSRPAVELLARVPLENIEYVADLGCGPGNSTALLNQRWPAARITGIDSSPAMIAEARSALPDCQFVEADIRNWQPVQALDLIFANASLQWLPDHYELFPHLVSLLNPQGVLAVQMSRPMCSCAKLPGNKTTRIAGVSRWLAFMLTTIF